jgi:hypothetical protein
MNDERSFLDLIESDEALDVICTDIARRALRDEFSPVTNAGVTPGQLMDRIRASTISQMASAEDISDDLSRSLVQAVEDLGI